MIELVDRPQARISIRVNPGLNSANTGRYHMSMTHALPFMAVDDCLSPHTNKSWVQQLTVTDSSGSFWRTGRGCSFIFPLSCGLVATAVGVIWRSSALSHRTALHSENIICQKCKFFHQIGALPGLLSTEHSRLLLEYPALGDRIVHLDVCGLRSCGRRRVCVPGCPAAQVSKMKKGFRVPCL